MNYQDHFRLNSPLGQDGIARDDAVFRGSAQLDAIAGIAASLPRGDAVVLIEGKAGTGKSTLAASAFRESVTQLTLGCLADAPRTTHELLEQLLLEFGFEPYKLNRTERLTAWRQHLAEMSATGTRTGILVENADELPADVLVELERLTAPDVRGVAGANLLLTCRKPIDGLKGERLTPLLQRCRAVIRIEPLSTAETEAYLDFCLDRVGADTANVLADGTSERIHEVSGGVIRCIDNVFESCLIRASIAKQDLVTAEIVERVAATLPGLTQAVAHPAEKRETGIKEAPVTPITAEVAEPPAGSPVATQPAEAAQAPEPRVTNIEPGPAPDVAAATAPAQNPSATVSSAEDAMIAIAMAVATGDGGNHAESGPASDTDTDAAAEAEAEADAPRGARATGPATQADQSHEDNEANGDNQFNQANQAELRLAATGVNIADIPVLEDAVAEASPANHQSALEDEPAGAMSGSMDDVLDLDAAAVEIVLASEDPAALPPSKPAADSDEESTGSAESDDAALIESAVAESQRTAADAEDNVLTDDSMSDDHGLSDEDRQQIEMLEAYANAEALEEMSESLAETLFGNADADAAAAALRAAFGSGTDEAEADDNQAAATYAGAAGR